MKLFYDILAKITVNQPTGSDNSTPAAGNAAGGGGAEGQSAVPAQGQGGFLENYGMIIMIVGMVVIMYFLLIRPQRKQQKELQAKISAIQKGDTILTSGGLYAKVVKIKESSISALLGGQLRVEVSKSHIVNVVEKAPIVDDDDDDEDEDEDRFSDEEEPETRKSRKNK